VSSFSYFKGSSVLRDPDPEEEDTRILHTTHQQLPTHQHSISQHSHTRGLDFPFRFCSCCQWFLTRRVENIVGVAYKNNKVTILWVTSTFIVYLFNSTSQNFSIIPPHKNTHPDCSLFTVILSLLKYSSSKQSSVILLHYKAFQEDPLHHCNILQPEGHTKQINVCQI